MTKDLSGIGGIGFGGVFDTVRKAAKSRKTVVQEIQDPVVDIFEEEEYILVVAEMPGISTQDVELTVEDDLLTIFAENEDKHYRKEILLPQCYPLEKMKMSSNNGILKIKCVI